MNASLPELERQQKNYKAVRARIFAAAYKPEPKPLLLPAPKPKPKRTLIYNRLVVTSKTGAVWLEQRQDFPRPCGNPLRNQSGRLLHHNSRAIIRRVCAASGLTEAELKGRSRSRYLIPARRLAMVLIVRYAGLSLPETGRILGGKDHTTVLHAVRKFDALKDERIAARKARRAARGLEW